MHPYYRLDRVASVTSKQVKRTDSHSVKKLLKRKENNGQRDEIQVDRWRWGPCPMPDKTFILLCWTEWPMRRWIKVGKLLWKGLVGTYRCCCYCCCCVVSACGQHDEIQMDRWRWGPCPMPDKTFQYSIRAENPCKNALFFSVFGQHMRVAAKLCRPEALHDFWAYFLFFGSGESWRRDTSLLA